MKKRKKIPPLNLNIIACWWKKNHPQPHWAPLCVDWISTTLIGGLSTVCRTWFFMTPWDNPRCDNLEIEAPFLFLLSSRQSITVKGNCWNCTGSSKWKIYGALMAWWQSAKYLQRETRWWWEESWFVCLVTCDHRPQVRIFKLPFVVGWYLQKLQVMMGEDQRCRSVDYVCLVTCDPKWGSSVVKINHLWSLCLTSNHKLD